MIKKFRTARLLLVGLLASAILFGWASPASAVPAVTLIVGDRAVLVSKGVAVEVPVTYSCSPDTTFTEISVRLTERVGGNRSATGLGFVSGLTCDGVVRSTVVTVRASSSGTTINAFRTGDAFAETTFFACTEVECATVRTSSVVRASNK